MDFENENIKISANKKKGCIVELFTTVFTKIIQKAEKNAIKIVNKNVSIDGFRKGKAPEKIILEKYFTKVKEAQRQEIANLAFEEVQKLVTTFKIHPNATVDYKIETLSDEEAKVNFVFETEPDIPKIDVKNIILEKIEQKKVEKKEIDELIRQTLFFYAKWEDVTREIQENDFVILDLEDLEKNEIIFKDVRFEVADKYMAKWMKELILKKHKGDVVEGESFADETITEEEKKYFKSKKVRITIKQVEKAILPKLDEDFLKKVGYKSIEDLQNATKNILENENKKEKEKKELEQINQFLLDNYKTDLPFSILEMEKTQRKENILKDPNFKDTYNKMTDQEKQHMDKKIEKDSISAISLFYISRKIVQDANIKISLKEIDEEAKKLILERTPLNQNPDIKNIKDVDRYIAVSRLYLKKAHDYILKNIKKGN